MEKLRIGMVGAGNICHAHLSAYRHDPRVEIVAICDIDFDRCNRTADEFGIPNRYKSVHEMVADRRRLIFRLATSAYGTARTLSALSRALTRVLTLSARSRWL